MAQSEFEDIVGSLAVVKAIPKYNSNSDYTKELSEMVSFLTNGTQKKKAGARTKKVKPVTPGSVEKPRGRPKGTKKPQGVVKNTNGGKGGKGGTGGRGGLRDYTPSLEVIPMAQTRPAL